MKRFAQLIFISLFVLTCLIFGALYWRALGRSLWLDETLSYWAVKDGLVQVFSRVWHWFGASPLYYVLLWIVKQIFGASEPALRLPSLLSVCASAFCFYHLLRMLDCRRAGIFAALMFLTIPQTLEYAAGARPYALALLLCFVSTLALLRYLKTPSRLNAALYVASSVLMIYASYFAGGMLLVHLTFGFRQAEQTNWKKLTGLWLLILLLTLPGIFQLHQLYARKTVISWVPRANIDHLLSVIFPKSPLRTVIFIGFGALLLSWRKQLAEFLKTLPQMFCFLFWAIAPVVLTFVVAAALDVRIFNERYYFYMLPGAVGLLAIVLQELERIDRRLGQSAIVLFELLILVPTFVQLQQPELIIGNMAENWRAAFNEVRVEAANRNSILLLWPGHAEQRDLSYLIQPETREIMLSPVIYYSQLPPTELLPFFISKAEEHAYLRQLTAKLFGRDQVFVVFRYPQPKTEAQLEIFLHENGFGSEIRKTFGETELLIFKPTN